MAEETLFNTRGGADEALSLLSRLIELWLFSLLLELLSSSLN